MVLDKEVLVKRKYNYDLDYYENLGYYTDQDFFLVKIEHLLTKSFTKVNVKCEYCGEEDFIPYYKWNRSMNSDIKKYCCLSCKGEKTKESNMLKYGVTSVAKLQSSKEKAKKTSLEKYGVENHLMLEDIKDKIKKTNLEKYGHTNPMKNKTIKEKANKTILEKWGVDNISKSEEIKEKKKNTCNKNFGVDYPLRSDKVKKRLKDTNLEKYGKDFFVKSEEYRKKYYDIAKNINYIKYINDGISLFKCDYGEEHEFEISKDVYNKRILYGVSLCTVCNPVGEGTSIKESNLLSYINSIYDGEIVQSHRDVLEIDIYLPDLNLGFEFNGLYYHSDKFRENNYHLNKTKYFEERGIRIIHIWEDDWDFKKEIIKSQINNLLNKSKILFARKCEVKEIKDSKISTKFLEENHIQGGVGSSLKLGLYHGEELVSLMTFDHYEGRNKMNLNEWNINRFCNKKGFSVTGGASKLFKYFLKNYDVSRVISYSDSDWSLGGLYEKLGFKKVGENNPDYKYIFDGVRVHKSRFRKSKTGISEGKLNMLKIWDCGKIKFEFNF